MNNVNNLKKKSKGEISKYRKNRRQIAEAFGQTLNEKTIELTGVNIKWQYKQYEDELEDLKEKIVEMDPALYNVLNGCWLCNYDKQNLENDYLMDRSFFNGVEGPPCNKPFIMIPKNSKD